LEIVGIVGAGTMGAGIAQIALEHGHEAVLYDVDEEAIGRGRMRVREGLARRAAKLDLDADTIDDWVEGRLAGLRQAEALVSLAAQTDIVIEAALEVLPLKQDIFRALDGEADPDAILATNTSALRVADVAALATHRERILGLHFFNPAPLMPLVEVVVTAETEPAVVERAERLLRSWDKTPVRSADRPGFIVNRVNRPFTIEALRLVETGEASVEAVDAALRDAGFPMGPFELMDLVGIDVNLAAARAVWDGLGRPERLRPSTIQERLVGEGRLGRKAGSGFYLYEDGRRGSVAPEFAGAATTLAPTVIADRILLAVINEAWHGLGDEVASEADIDLALRLGAAYPIGPFERTKRLGGTKAVVAALERLAGSDDRYIPADALRGR
jgi:3-hydroxybutyryl-CoA dehydrogenase